MTKSSDVEPPVQGDVGPSPASLPHAAMPPLARQTAKMQPLQFSRRADAVPYETQHILDKMPAPIRLRFKPPVLENESADEYLMSFAMFADAVEPTNPFEWVLLKDYVDIEWEIQRSRRLKTAMTVAIRRAAILSVVRVVVRGDERTETDEELEAKAKRFVTRWETEDDLLNGLSDYIHDPRHHADDVTARLLAARSKELEFFDKSIAAGERRRNSLLAEIGRRREFQARLDERRKASQRFAADRAIREN